MTIQSKDYSPWSGAANLIQTREGYVDHWYFDSLGIATGGWGHKQVHGDPLKFDTVLAYKWFTDDLQIAFNAMARQVSMLALPVKPKWLLETLTSVNFQLDTDWYKKFPKTWRLLQQHEFALAAIEVQDSLWFKQTPIRVQDFQQALIYTQGKWDAIRS